jgi:hypothetical protein
MKISPGRVLRAAKGLAIPCYRNRGQKTEINKSPASAAAIAAVADFFKGEQERKAATAKMKTLLISSVALILTAFLFSAAGRISAEDKYQEMINCNLHAGPCTQSLAENTVILEVTPRPVKAMQDLLFKVTLTGKIAKALKAPYIDLGMPGMNMGPNRVHLKPAGNATYEGRGVIVRCPSGRRTWQATVTIPDAGQIDYTFDVIY